MGTQTSFPVFEADQVLTNTHLNDLRNYLDGQARLTRNKLVGAGIVCGLQITSSPGAISVSKGCGLTSQGYLLMLCDSDFTHYVPYTTPDVPEAIAFIKQCGDADGSKVPFFKPGFSDGLFELITTTDLESLTAERKAAAVALTDPSGASLDNFAVVLFLEAEQLKLKNCDTNDCNDKGSRMDFSPRVLLVPKSLLDQITTTGGNTSSLPRLALGRYNVPVQNLLTTSAVLAAFAAITNDATINKIDDALNRSYTRYSNLLQESAGNPFGGIGDALKEIRRQILTANPLFIQYFYDFLDDLIKAYHEFREKAANVSSECCIDEMRFPFHLMLGEADVSTTSGENAAYREYFIYSPLFDKQGKELEEVRMLFTRLKLMATGFAPDAPSQFLKREIKVTPSEAGKTYLSNRCIPYYYNVSGALNRPPLHLCWDYKKTRSGEAEYNLGYNADKYTDPANREVLEPLLYDVEPYNFFRVEGHIGKGADAALANIITLKQQYNLPFETIALSADYIGAILKGDDPQCVLQDLESDYRIVIAEFMCKLHDAFCDIYSFEFKPKPLLAVTAVTGVDTKIAGKKTAAKAAVAVTETPLAADTQDDDNEVLDLLNGTSFTGLNVNHPVLSRLVSEAHLTKVYVKGSSLQQICGVKKGSIGDVYLSNIADGRFVNPVSLNSNIKAAGLYFRFFELIDSIESMFKILLSNELSELNMTEFKVAYDRYEKAVTNLSKQLQVITDKLEVFLSTCIVEKLEALKDEYNRRMNQYILARRFNNYFKQHGGIEHKAGVPKGGTFILVYFEDTRAKRFDVSALFVNKKLGALMLAKHPDLLQADLPEAEIKIATDELETAVALQCPEQYNYFNNAVKDFLDKDQTISAASRQALLAAIRKPPESRTPPLVNGTVIADFYVPYICCSDCTPVSYILQPTEPLPLSVTAAAPVCNAEGTQYTVKIAVSGGTPPYNFSVNNVSQPDENIVLASGSADTKVLVTDAAGKTTEVIVKSHTCPVPCLLPCGGASTTCNYVLWVAQPESKVGISLKDATLKLTNENGQSFSPVVLSIFKDVFAQQNNTLTAANYGQTFKALCDKMNEVVPVAFTDAGKRMFNYEPQNRLLQIDKFDCHDVVLNVQVTMELPTVAVVLNVTYDKNGTTITDVRRQATAQLPPFGCVQLNKCSGVKKVLCTESVSITKITGNQETFNQPFFNFKAEPAFDIWFWYFHTGTPFFSTDAAPQHIQITSTDGKPLVRVLGIKKATGCFAIREENVPLGFIVG